MFEEDVELENKKSSFLPMLMIGVLVCAIGYGLFYVISDSQRKLTVEQATPLVLTQLTIMAPPMLEFHTGIVVYGMKENPSDPHFKLLAKAGLITAKPMGRPNEKISITLTDKGKHLLDSIPGVKKKDDKDNTVDYQVPLAVRKFDKVSGVTMQGSTHAVVDYTWLWEPNEMGKVLDASGSLLKSMGTYERQTMIDKFGAKFYTTAGPQTARLGVGYSSDKGWQIGQ